MPDPVIKTIITVYGHLSTDRSRTTSYLFYRIVRRFFDEGRLVRVICQGYNKDAGIDPDLICTPGRLYAIANKLISIIAPRLPGNQTRVLKEWLFDIFCSRNIGNGNNYQLLNLKPLLPLSVRAARRAREIVTLATTAHPRFNCRMIRRLQSMYHLPNQSSYTNKWRVRRMEQALHESDKVLLMVRSDFIYDTYREAGIEDERLFFLGETSAGVDKSVFLPKEDKTVDDTLVFLTLGNLTMIKGTPLLLDAWQEVQLKEDIDAELVMSGKTDADFDELLSREDCKSIKGLHRTGYVRDLVAAYQNADVFISASVSDNGPATVLEAMSCGLPVIVSTHCGFSEFITDGEEGFTYDPFDKDTLKNLICWFSNNREKIPEMGRKARLRTGDFLASDYVNQVYKACYPDEI